MSSFRKAPEYFGFRTGLDGLAVGIIMLHVRVFLHQRRMLQIVRGVGQYEFMRKQTRVSDDKLDLLAALHLKCVRVVGHPAVIFPHRDSHDAERLLGIARLARREVFFSFMRVQARAGANCRGPLHWRKMPRSAKLQRAKGHDGNDRRDAKDAAAIVRHDLAVMLVLCPVAVMLVPSRAKMARCSLDRMRTSRAACLAQAMRYAVV